MNNKKPIVSVIIPAYNRGYIIRKSIDSVLAQSFTNFELIIIDDGSTDDTKDVIESYNDDRIRYIYQDNAGACVARNNGISHSKGEYVAFHDSDDEWLPMKLKIQLKTIKKTGADIVSCQMLMKTTDGKQTTVPKLKKSEYLSLKNLPPGISTQTLFMKREVAENLLFDSDMPRLQDMEWLLRAARRYKIYCIKQYLVNYEVQSDSISAALEKLYKAIILLRKKHPDIKESAPIIAEELSKSMIDHGMIMLKNDNPNYSKYLSLGYYLSNKKCSRIKYYIAKFHLFKLLYRALLLRRKR